MQQFQRGQVFLASDSALVPGLLHSTKTPHLCLPFLSTAHGGQNVPPHPMLLQVSLDLYSRSSLSGPREACLLEGTWRKIGQNQMSKVKRPTGRNREKP